VKFLFFINIRPSGRFFWHGGVRLSAQKSIKICPKSNKKFFSANVRFCLDFERFPPGRALFFWHGGSALRAEIKKLRKFHDLTASLFFH
jgi:hypothetical protein